MALKDVDLGAALRNLADRRIEEAMEAGKFDNLPGAGKPLNLEPLPADEEARAMYWALKILKNADVETDELRYRKRIALLREELAACSEEARAKEIIAEHNNVVRRLNSMGTTAIRYPLNPLDEAAEMEAVRKRMKAQG